jgi:hypothetical protein
MITPFLFPELFEPADSLFPVRVKRTPKAEDPQASVARFAASFQAPEDFEFLIRVLSKNPELRVGLYKAVRKEGYFPGCKRESS